MLKELEKKLIELGIETRNDKQEFLSAFEVFEQIHKKYQSWSITDERDVIRLLLGIE